ncbi:hypothetical protein FSP39_002256 [Pinctada imbricata]|uniref:Nuclear respiratory factor 1 NLS/DNA-binding dimerisation domain-containing protein n=1 Tax=Pinctada imbricata TaxID=66713 RepID=A0AA89C669_PINIB|nr:hypothetical protein FSP39_002256 [Pinctada imbricata]
MNMSYQVVSSDAALSMGGVGNNSNMTMNNVNNIGHINSGMMSDDISEPSSPDSTSFDASELLSSSCNDDVTAQLAAAGPIGVAAAAAIASSRKHKHPHHFETNPSKRKRQQTRLLRKLKNTIDEYTTRIGQQAVVLCCTPGKLSQSVHSFKVFGSQPLENVVRNNKNLIMQELESSLAEQTPQTQPDNTGLHELPPLIIDGIPTPVDKMTQAQLRNFIPEMLKYSTGRSKPGWGKEECRPIWWPSDLPWANVRSDARTEQDKTRVSWTEALRTIVKNCYKHHAREDLLHVFNEESSNAPVQSQAIPQAQAFPGTMVQTINNPDGTVSFIQIDAAPQSVVTLPDGTQATVVHAVSSYFSQRKHAIYPATVPHEATQAVHTLAEVAASQQHDLTQGLAQVVPTSMEITGDVGQPVSALPINHGGQIILAGGDGQIGGIVTIPVSMYHTVTGATVAMTMVPDQQQVGMQQVTMAHPTALTTSSATIANISDIIKSDVSQVEVITVRTQYCHPYIIVDILYLFV